MPESVTYVSGIPCNPCPRTGKSCRIEVINTICNGLLIRALMNPSLKREAVITALRPVLRTALTPRT
jgi:hypothetical protein